MEGNIGAQVIIFISYVASIVLAIGLGMRIMKKSVKSGKAEK